MTDKNQIQKDNSNAFVNLGEKPKDMLKSMRSVIVKKYE